MNKIKNKFGFSLLEIIVATALFSTTIISAVEIFSLVLSAQRNAIASKNLQEDIRYAFEAIAKEVRMARINNGNCATVGENKIYDLGSSGGTELYFKNYHDECVKYSLENNRLKIERGANAGYITPDEVKINSLKFIVHDNYPVDQSSATMVMDVETIVGKKVDTQRMLIQTTLSSRYY